MKNKKRIAFDDTDGRHAKLRVQLQRDGLSQAEFFRAYITAYLEKDANEMSFIHDYKLNNSVGQKRSYARFWLEYGALGGQEHDNTDNGRAAQCALDSGLARHLCHDYSGNDFAWRRYSAHRIGLVDG